MRCGHDESDFRIVSQFELAHDCNILAVQQLKINESSAHVMADLPSLTHLDSRLLKFDFMMLDEVEQMSLVENSTTIGLERATSCASLGYR